MGKVTARQRHERTQSPYTITRTSKGEFGAVVHQLIGVVWTPKFNGEDWDVVREELDLGTHSNLMLVAKAAEEFRADPEKYYEEYQRAVAEQMKNAVLNNPDKLAA